MFKKYTIICLVSMVGVACAAQRSFNVEQDFKVELQNRNQSLTDTTKVSVLIRKFGYVNNVVKIQQIYSVFNERGDNLVVTQNLKTRQFFATFNYIAKKGRRGYCGMCKREEVVEQYNRDILLSALLAGFDKVERCCQQDGDLLIYFPLEQKTAQ